MLGFCWNIPPLASINSDILALLFRLLETSAFWAALGFSSVYPTLPKVNILLTRCGDVKTNHLWASYCLQCMMYVQTSTHDIIRSISTRGIISSWLSVLNTDWVSKRTSYSMSASGNLSIFLQKTRWTIKHLESFTVALVWGILQLSSWSFCIPDAVTCALPALDVHLARQGLNDPCCQVTPNLNHGKKLASKSMIYQNSLWATQCFLETPISREILTLEHVRSQVQLRIIMRHLIFTLSP